MAVKTKKKDKKWYLKQIPFFRKKIIISWAATCSLFFEHDIAWYSVTISIHGQFFILYHFGQFNSKLSNHTHWTEPLHCTCSKCKSEIFYSKGRGFRISQTGSLKRWKLLQFIIFFPQFAQVSTILMLIINVCIAPFLVQL